MYLKKPKQELNTSLESPQSHRQKFVSIFVASLLSTRKEIENVMTCLGSRSQLWNAKIDFVPWFKSDRAVVGTRRAA